jgi:hypothetical protein
MLVNGGDPQYWTYLRNLKKKKKPLDSEGDIGILNNSCN